MMIQWFTFSDFSTGGENDMGAAVVQLCQVCDNTAAGFHCGAFVCEACKKFYLRAMKQNNRAMLCCKAGDKRLGNSTPGGCQVSGLSRTSCAFCRLQKCLSIGMEAPGMLMSYFALDSLAIPLFIEQSSQCGHIPFGCLSQIISPGRQQRLN